MSTLRILQMSVDQKGRQLFLFIIYFLFIHVLTDW